MVVTSMPFILQRKAKKDKEFSLPILCMQARISYKIVGAPRMNGQLTIFKDKVNIIVYGLEKDKHGFCIHKFAIKLVPDMDRMIIVGTPGTDQDDIFIFLHSKNERDKCIICLELIGCTIWDTANTQFLHERDRISRSLPNMQTIHE